MTVSDRILALFTADDVVLRPSEIMRRTKIGEHTTRNNLVMRIASGRLFDIASEARAREVILCRMCDSRRFAVCFLEPADIEGQQGLER